MAKNKTELKQIESITHEDASRKHIPTVECQSILRKEDQSPIRVAYDRRNCDLDPQLVWRGKYEQERSDLLVQAPPLFIQEKVHPKALIDELVEQARKKEQVPSSHQMSLFDDFNGLPSEDAKTEFYQHDANWSNRMILGDSLQAMTSLAEREGLKGKVQCVYFDPPYGIKFNSNFQWSTATSKVDSSDRLKEITREPEQVKAFRDTWSDGIHSYLTYISDRLIVVRELLADTGCIIFQIGDENVHRVRTILDDVFGDKNFVCQVTVKKTHHQESKFIPSVADYLLIYAKDKDQLKYRAIRPEKNLEGIDFGKYNKTIDGELRINSIRSEWKIDPSLIPSDRIPIRTDITLTQDGDSGNSQVPWKLFGEKYFPGKGRHWRTHEQGRQRLYYAGRVSKGKQRPFYIEPWNDKPSAPSNNIWTKSLAGAQHKLYVVQTNVRIVERALLSFSDPGDLILDPTCGSGTTAYVAEQWGRRWITIDTSRVALALARSRVMGGKYPYYLLADSKDGAAKLADLTRNKSFNKTHYNKITHGFVYKRLPHIKLKDIANNSEIDLIWHGYEPKLRETLKKLNAALSTSWEEWEVPREHSLDWSQDGVKLHSQWWKLKIQLQREIDSSIAAKSDFVELYDKPYEDSKKVRVAGPFTIESLSPHRVLAVDEDDQLIDQRSKLFQQDESQDFVQMILENLKTAGVQQAHKEDRITFSSVTPWPGEYYICAEGIYYEGVEEAGNEKRAAIFVGPEFGTVSRPDLVAAAREAGDAGFDTLIVCAFNYDAHSSDFSKLGRIPVLKARMNADLHMADDLKNTGKGNLFVIFGEPDIDILDAEKNQIQVKINGVDVFHPNTGEVRSDGAEGIACWFIDTDYNEESFFVRHAYFLGANDPYKALKKTLKAEINKEAWDTLNSDISRPFDKPESGRIAVKVINHLGDEVMKVYRVN